MFKMGPFLLLAKSVGEEDKFYEYFFKVWFEKWPIDKWARSDSVSVEQLKEMVKKVRSYSFTVAVLTYYLFNRMFLAIIRISCVISIVSRFLRVNGLAAFKLPLTPLAQAWTSTLMMTMTSTISYMYPLTWIPPILAYPSDTLASSSVCL